MFLCQIHTSIHNVHFRVNLSSPLAVICTDCPLNDSDGSQLLSNGEEKLAERMMKDSEPRKSLGGWERN